MTDHLRDTATRLLGLLRLGSSEGAAGVIGGALSVLVDEGYIAILPRQPTLPTLESVSPIEPTSDPKGYASVLVQEINNLTGRNFKVTDDYTKMARTLIKEKIPLEQARQAIKAQHAEWGNDPKWGKYVRPSTMLRASNMKRYVADLEAGPVKRQAAHTFKQLGD